MKKTIALTVASLCFCASQVFAADSMLRLKERVPLEKLAAEVMDPASPRYGKFFSPEEIRDIAGPDERTYGALIHDLKNRGYQIMAEDKTRLFITVRSPKNMSALSSLSLLNSGLIENIIVADNSRKSRPRLLTSSEVRAATSLDQIRALYEFNPIYSMGVTGKGQHIAIATYDGFNMDDVTEYFDKMKFSQKPSVDIVNFNGTAALNSESAVETEIDAEFSGQIAPGAQIHVFASSQNNDLGEVQLFTAILAYCAKNSITASIQS